MKTILDLVFGEAEEVDETVHHMFAPVAISENANDSYLVEVWLTRMVLARPRGPKRFRREVRGYYVKWRCDEGIPFRKGTRYNNFTTGSFDLTEELVNSNMWLAETAQAIVENVNRNRAETGYYELP